MIETISFKLNHKPVRLEVDGERMLLWVLRTHFDLTGARYGCGEGHCGACTVLVNNRAERSCQYPVKNVRGKEVITIEGLSRDGKLHPLQAAFMKHNAVQCGFCTPAMILSAYSLLLRNPEPSYEDIVQGMDDVLCRCGTYNRVVDAIQSAAPHMGGKK